MQKGKYGAKQSKLLRILCLEDELFKTRILDAQLLPFRSKFRTKLIFRIFDMNSIMIEVLFSYFCVIYLCLKSNNLCFCSGFFSTILAPFYDFFRILYKLTLDWLVFQILNQLWHFQCIKWLKSIFSQFANDFSAQFLPQTLNDYISS